MFDNSGSSVLVTFDRTLFMDSSAGFPVAIKPDCTAVLATLASLGTGPQCAFTSLTTLAITLGAAPSLLPFPAIPSTITLKANAIANAAQTATYAASTGGVFSAQPPSNPATPVAVLVAPSIVGSCSALLLDGSRSFGFALRAGAFSWSLLSLSPANAAHHAAVQAILSATNVGGNASFVQFAAGDLLAGTQYKFSLVVTNFLQQSSAPVTATVFKDFRSLPELVLQAPASVYRSQ